MTKDENNFIQEIIKQNPSFVPATISKCELVSGESSTKLKLSVTYSNEDNPKHPRFYDSEQDHTEAEGTFDVPVFIEFDKRYSAQKEHQMQKSLTDTECLFYDPTDLVTCGECYECREYTEGGGGSDCYEDCEGCAAERMIFFSAESILQKIADSE